MPFLCVGTLGLLVAIILLFVVPDAQAITVDSSDGDGNDLTMTGIATVIKFLICTFTMINILKVNPYEFVR